MNQLIIKTSVSKEVEKKITLPSFWKQSNHTLLAAINEKTAIRLFTSADGSYISISHGTSDDFKREIIEADTNWDPTTEQEFLAAYDDAHEAIRMKPMLIETGREQAYRDFAQTQNT